jgi:signal peptidase I
MQAQAQGQNTNSSTTNNSTADNLSNNNNPPFIGRKSIYAVVANSMMPTLRVGDIVGVENQTSFSNLKVGDIIVFKSPGVREDTGQPEVIIARVKQIYNTPQGERIIRTQGDANPHSIYLIDYPILSNNYIGKVLFITTKEFMTH